MRCIKPNTGDIKLSLALKGEKNEAAGSVVHFYIRFFSLSLHGGFLDAVKRSSNWTSQRQQLVKLDDWGSLVFFGKWHHLTTKTNPRATAMAFVDKLALRWRKCMFLVPFARCVFATGCRVLLWLFEGFTGPATLLQCCWGLALMSRPASHHPSHASLSGRLQGLSCVAGHVCSWRWRPCYANPPLRLRKVPFLPAQKENNKEPSVAAACGVQRSHQNGSKSHSVTLPLIHLSVHDSFSIPDPHFSPKKDKALQYSIKAF